MKSASSRMAWGMSPQHRDIQERTFRFACEIVDFCEILSASSSQIRRRMAGQLFDAGTSVASNLEEAVAGQTKPDFITKVFIALKEARESYFWLRLIRVKAGKPIPRADWLVSEANEIVAILTSIARNARSNPSRGDA